MNQLKSLIYVTNIQISKMFPYLKTHSQAEVDALVLNNLLKDFHEGWVDVVDVVKNPQNYPISERIEKNLAQNASVVGKLKSMNVFWFRTVDKLLYTEIHAIIPNFTAKTVQKSEYLHLIVVCLKRKVWVLSALGIIMWYLWPRW